MTNPNDPAFEGHVLSEQENGASFILAHGGLTKRELFAVKMMAAIVAGRYANPDIGLVKDSNIHDIAIEATLLTDALIARLNEKKP